MKKVFRLVLNARGKRLMSANTTAEERAKAAGLRSGEATTSLNGAASTVENFHKTFPPAILSENAKQKVQWFLSLYTSSS